MERRRGEVPRDGVPASMAHHHDVGRRMALRPRRRDGRDAPPRPGRRRPGDARPARGLRRPPGRRAGRRAGSSCDPDDGPPQMDELPRSPGRRRCRRRRGSRSSTTTSSSTTCQFDPADPDRVQSIFDWDMTTLGEPLVDLGTLLNYWPDPSDPPNAGRVSHEGLLTMGLPTRAGDHRPLRRAHRPRRVVGRLVRGVRPVEDGRRHPAAAQPLAARREHRPADGDDRRPPADAAGDGVDAARSARVGKKIKNQKMRRCALVPILLVLSGYRLCSSVASALWAEEHALRQRRLRFPCHLGRCVPATSATRSPTRLTEQLVRNGNQQAICLPPGVRGGHRFGARRPTRSERSSEVPSRLLHANVLDGGVGRLRASTCPTR